MIALKRILFPTDFSEQSGEAAKYACALTEQFGAELHLLHVFEEPLPTVYVPGVALTDKVIAEIEEKAAAALQEAVESDWEEKNRVLRTTAQGVPFVEIIRYAKDKDIDLIVMGTHGRSGLSHLLIGSTAERVVRKAPCPVLTVRPGEHEFVMP